MARDNRRHYSSSRYQAVLIPFLCLLFCYVSEVQGACSPAPSVLHATAVEDAVTANYTCDPGYVDAAAAGTTPHYVCNGTAWVEGIQGLDCKADCSDTPTDVAHSTHTDDGAITTYVCDLGYLAENGASTWDCVAKDWEAGGVFTCSADCSDTPTDVAHSTHSDDGAITTYVCDLGYLAENGASTWDCVGKDWEAGGVFTCSADCSDTPTDVAHSTHSDDGAITTYVCDLGYLAENGASTWDCVGKDWEAGGVFTCSADCSDTPTDVAHSTHTDDGAITTYVCDLGYLAENGASTWDCVAKDWEAGGVFTCSADCSDTPTDVAHSTHTDDGAITTYVCDFGYLAENGASTWDCVAKDWEAGGVFTCSADCSDTPTDVAHSTHTDDGAITTYVCDLGYLAENGASTWDCVAKDWEAGGVFTCSADCSDTPTDVAHSTHADDGAITTYVCDFGYLAENGASTWDCVAKDWEAGGVFTCSADCSDTPTDVAHSTHTDDGAITTYVCDFGYLAENGASTWDCVAKDWEAGGVFTCSADCSDTPTDVAHSTHTDDGAITTYVCDFGYLAENGASTWDCVAKDWEAGGVFTCSADCSDTPTDVAHSTHTDDGAITTYVCDFGYLAENGASTWDCVAKDWEAGGVFTCSADCSDTPTDVAHSTHTDDGAITTYVCDIGYLDTTGAFTWVCVAKDWEAGGVLTCSEECSDVTPVGNGTYTHDNVTATFKCDLGYRDISGSLEWDCIGKTWGPDGPLTCGADCSDKANVTHSTVVYTVFEARYTCDFGYDANGDEVYDCQSKLWDPNGGADLICYATCEDSPNVTFSTKVEDGNIKEDYKCDFGYFRTGDIVWDCALKNWTSNYEALTCTPDCTDSPNITHSTKTNDNVTEDYKCIFGYHSQGDTQWDCFGKDWNATRVELTCLADCSDSPNITFSTYVKYEDALNVTYRCDFGYYVSGDTVWDCFDKDWLYPSPELLECIPDCSDALNITHSNFTEDGFTATYDCFHGYRVTEGNLTWDCENKIWPPLDVELNCTADCSDAPSVNDGAIINNSTLEAEYACNVGYNGSGEYIWDCRHGEKNWTDTALPFICADCRDAPNITNSVHYEYRARMFYRCVVGYTDYEDTTFNCLTKTWDPTNTTLYCSLECDETVSMVVDASKLNVPQGFIASVNFPIANYNDSKTCIFKLTTNNPIYVMEINLLSFKLEADTYCEYDSLSIYDGNSTEDPLLARICGESFPAMFTSSSKDLYMILITDDTINEPGFNFTYTPVDISYPGCLGFYIEYTATTTVQTISSTGSTQYFPNIDEYWLLTSTGGTLILLLTAIDVEVSEGCIYDRIIIYNGGCASFDVLHTHCGTNQKRWELSGTEYLVQFHSDSSVETAGFTMEYYIGTPATGTTATTSTTAGPPIKVEVNLVNELLLNYSAAAFPSRNFGKPIEYTIDAFLVGINGLDEVKQKLTTTLLFEIKWVDGLIHWPPTKKSGIVKLLIPQNEIWKPDMALLNGFEKIQEMGAKFMYVVVDYTGACTWRPYQIMNSVCNVEMRSYPFDEQSCDLKFGTWVTTPDQVSTGMGATGLNTHETFTENSEWALLSTSSSSNSDSTVTFTLKVKRNESFVVLYIAIPIVLLSGLTAFTFVLPFSSRERANYSVVLFVSFVVYIIVLYQKMPKNSEKLSNFVIYVLAMACASCAAVIITTIESRMRTLDKTRKGIPRCVKSSTKFIQRIQKAVFCHSRGDTVEKLTSTRGNSAGLQSESDDPGSMEWPDVVSAMDFIFFWIYLLGITAATLYVFVDLS